ncbi:hypothetical protein MYX75_12650 [Acidobacteria bacterium AH-259-A15]|nr:hypothetical protein [Acidobacteria bacterium AH-259-A15]
MVEIGSTNHLVIYFLILHALLWVPSYAQSAEKASDPRVYVLLWFDTEDYVLPASDDAALRLCQFLTDEGIRATFKLVGEKARVLEKRRRQDVIAALQKHEIGYHSNFHSVHPTPAEFLSGQGWEDGVAEFERRERRGLDDVERITGQKPSCYGQPGSSWGPQQFGALRKLGVPVYLDAGSHVSLGGAPFWYGGILNLYALKTTLRTRLGGPQDLEEARKEFVKAYDTLLAEGGGPVSIYYHPCEFVHRQFWDGVNFAKGANPARSEWKVPPQKSPEETRIAYETFERYIRFIKSHPKVQFITASEALELYRDKARGRWFSAHEVRTIAMGVKKGIAYQTFSGISLSASEQLSILNQFVLAGIRGKALDGVRLRETPDGPTLSAPEHGDVSTPRSQFERTVTDVADYLARHRRVPNLVWLGSVFVSPESYLGTLARAALLLTDEKPLPQVVVFKPMELLVSAHVQEDNPKLWGWVIFPPAFSAPQMMQLAKRQAWTLKPALLAGSRVAPIE